MATRLSQAIPRDLCYEPTPKRVRAQAGGETVADSRRPTMVFETGLPTKYMTVDGDPAERPTTQWSHGIRSAPRGGGSGARQRPHETTNV